MEYKDPGRYIPIICLLYSWGSLFGVPSRVPLKGAIGVFRVYCFYWVYGVRFPQIRGMFLWIPKMRILSLGGIYMGDPLLRETTIGQL